MVNQLGFFLFLLGWRVIPHAFERLRTNGIGDGDFLACGAGDSVDELVLPNWLGGYRSPFVRGA